MPCSAIARRYFCLDKRSPWHLVPADQNGYTAYVLARTLHDTLLKMNPRYLVAKSTHAVS